MKTRRAGQLLSVTETNVKHVESQPATDDVQVPVTQLSALENTITSALSSLEQSNWSNSLRIISHIDELGKAVLVQQKSVSNNTESLNSKIQYQKEHISTLQRTTPNRTSQLINESQTIQPRRGFAKEKTRLQG